jgi:hypothetical protein
VSKSACGGSKRDGDSGSTSGREGSTLLGAGNPASMSAAGMGDAAPSSSITHNAIRLAIALPDRKPRATLKSRMQKLGIRREV